MAESEPVGWAAWLAFLESEEYSRDVDALMSAIASGRALDVGLSISCLASCAFAAGLDATTPAPAAPREAGSAGEGER